MTAILTLAEVEPSFETAYGVKVAFIGEDGDGLILGHVDVRRALAAWHKRMRIECGVGRYGEPAVEQRWALFFDHNPDCRPALAVGHYADCIPEDWEPRECECRESSCVCDPHSWYADWSVTPSERTIAVTVVSR